MKVQNNLVKMTKISSDFANVERALGLIDRFLKTQSTFSNMYKIENEEIKNGKLK